MDLAAKSSALLRSKLVMRLGCVLVAVGFLVSSVVTPRARAVAVVDDVAVGAMSCAAFLESIGLPLSATGGAGAVSGGITAVAGEYAAATGAAASGEAVLGSIAAGTAISTAGTIILTAAAVAACAGLAYWLYNTYFVDDSGGVLFDTAFPVYLGPSMLDDIPCGRLLYQDVLLIDRSVGINLADRVVSNSEYSIYYTVFFQNGSGRAYTPFFYSPHSFSMIHYYSSGSKSNVVYSTYDSVSGWHYAALYTMFSYIIFEDLSLPYFDTSDTGTVLGSDDFLRYVLDLLPDPDTDILLGGMLGATVIPDYQLPEIQPNQSMEITIPSAAPGSTLAELVEAVPQQVADGTLSATYTIDTAAPTPPSISDGDVEDVDELGLPSLGEALTRRFPFSIPWDIARGFTLLAAPAKTPYFEVDFYAPISDLVGGWKGSTKIVLDFSQFESLGRLSRWTSTIGFCLFLASATKRFIWTA